MDRLQTETIKTESTQLYVTSVFPSVRLLYCASVGYALLGSFMVHVFTP